MNEYISLLLEGTSKFADEIALVDRNGKRATDYKTYGELMKRTASWVYSKNLNERSFIPVRFESSMEFAAVVCGVWLSGHAAVPMGKHFPEERVKYISMNCDAPFIIDDDVIDEIRSTEIVDISLFPESTDEDIAFLLYTSGSTGMPKGILHNFAGLLANQKLGNKAVYEPGQRWVMGAPFYFVASVAIYKILTYGGCIHLVDEATMKDVRKLEDYYADNKITVGFISPSVLSNFQSKSDSLKVVMTGSERLTGQCSKDGYKLYNNYGMSETMGTVCSFLVEKPYDTTPVGIPPEGTVWALLDEDMNPVPDGEEGEYCTKGPYTVGYFKDPEATDKLFRGGWLHSGDILKKLPDGNLVYINRKDWMVKINGQRVEPGEIENVLRAIEGVDKSVVKAIKGAGDKIVLCAYYTGEEFEDEYLSDKLSEKLASYMIPAFYVHMDEFPLNQNGKIDRKNLPEPDIMSKRAKYAPPEDDVQAMLCRAFENALSIDQVGIDDDFFAIGGDSIRVMKLASECPELDLNSKLIYSAKTPREIAKHCAKTANLKKRVKKDEYPLSGAQMGMYIESINRDGEAVYNNPILLKLDNSIDMEKLRLACEAVVEAHPFIKLGIKTDSDGNPIQYRRDDDNYTQSIEKVSEEEFERIIPTLMQPFRLLKDKLYRIRLFETENNKYIFIDLHHIIFDGASMIVMFKDLERAYKGNSIEKELYSGFEVAEDEEDKKREFYEDAKKWYLETFGGLEVDSLPIPDKKDEEMSFGVETMDFALEISEVEAFCRKCGITENVYATASFGLLMGLYSGMNEALFTTIYNGRDSLRTARTIAMMVKTLPVYARFEGNESIRDYVNSVKEQMLGCMNNDIYSFTNLVEEIGMNSNLMFVYQGDVLDVGGFDGTDIERIELMDSATGEQLAMQMYKQNGGYNIRAEYRSDLYSKEFIQVLLRSFENVLVHMLRGENIEDVSAISYIERESIDKWNKTETDYDRSQTIISMFKESARKYPDNLAVICEEEKYTYKEVDKITDNLAAYIEGLGLGRGDVVSVLIPRGVYQVIASLGVLKAGCAYQPLDATYPSERLNFMVKDSDAGLIITNNELGEIITEYSKEILYIDDIEKLEDKTPKAVCEPCDTFVLLYTSGSTGVPKGVKLTHANLVCVTEWVKRYYEISDSDVCGQYASYGFDACLFDMYPALAAGAAICIVPEEMRLNLTDTNEYLIKNKVSLFLATTQVGRQFATEMENPHLRALTTGGEKLASTEPPKSFKFYNAYGPTECTILATVYPVTKKEDNIPIGGPIDDVKLYVVDAFNHMLPPGAIGELIIAGPHVADGYLNRPDKTKEVFIDNPFDDGEYKKAYRTGDIVRFKTDGAIEFVGRRDGQVKIHGFRIELTEVEAVIRDIEGIKDVAVVARDLGDDGKAIAAYYVTDDDIKPTDIADYILERKPPYMVPASIMQIDKIPLNQNSKVNKKALPEPVIEVYDEDDSHVDNVLEIELKNIIGKALNMDNPPLNTPLEYLGFTSLSMIRMSTTLLKRFGVNIPVKEMKGVSISGIENIILEGWMKGEGRGGDSLSSVEEESTMPLSAAQSGVFIECMKNPNSTSYNVPAKLTFDKDIKEESLIEAVYKVLKAHPSIFVHFDMDDNNVMIIRDEEKMPDIPVLTMSASECNKFKDDFVKPFHLSRGPLFEFAIVRTPEDVNLFVDFHHLIFDGFSMNLFLKELGTALKDANAVIDKEGASYFAYIKNQKQMLEGERAEKYDKYFATLLEDYESSTELPADISTSETEGKKCFAYKNVDEKVIQDTCKKMGVEEPGLFLAGLYYTLARVSASDSIYITTISSGRSDIRFADTFGMFVNTLPLASKLSDISVSEYIREVSEGLDKALEYENYPFADVAAKWGYNSNVMYEYQRGVVENLDIPYFNKAEGLETGQAKFGITVRIIDKDGSLAIEVEYSDDSYSKKAIEEFLDSYAIVLDKFSLHGRDKIRTITLLDEKRSQLLDSYRRRDYDVKLDDKVLFHTGIEKNAASNPDKLAITAFDGDYSYKELDENANRIANALIDKGVKPQDRVAILLPRTAKLFFAIYGVLKAGASFIPCDPNYPVERIRHIIEDSQAKTVITTDDRLERFKDIDAENVDSLLEESNVTKPDVNISLDDIAYLIYTSGSTGKPKGVMLRHRGIVNYVTDCEDNILVHGMVTRGHVLTTVTTISFDFSIKEWGVPLYNGLTLSVAADDEINDAKKLATRMKATGTDIFGATPSRLLTLMESKEFREALDNCTVLINGGEKYPKNLLLELQKKKDRLMFNTYGPTETTVSSNTQELSGYDFVNVGPPLPGVVEYIVDTDGNEVPPYVTGELYIGGIGVAAGYNNLPEMTAEKFIDYQGIRVYKSGDYARWLDNGDVEILGRRDNQIKLRGLRIELDEVESVLSSVEGIERSAVKIEKINGIEHLCAWFSADHEVDIAELKYELGRTLTNYMVPTAYMQLDEMPMTPNGKLDLKNLPLPELYRSKDNSAPKTPTEEAFCDIFGKLLHVEDVGANENFFELGGTSLLVTNVVIEATKKGLVIDFASVFDNPTPSELAAVVTSDGDSLVADEDKEITDYDYTAIDEMLSKNTLESFKKGEALELGNVLLTGATGFLGIHVLNELLNSTDEKIYCLLRSKPDISAEERLVRMYFYYFDSNLGDVLGERVFVIDGDITNPKDLESLEDKNISSVINCAAVVKHFSSGTIIEDVNVGGALNLIDFCLKTKAMMVQTSTMSVVTNAYKDNVPTGFLPDEHSLYCNQILENKYVHSKFLSERAVLDAVVNKGLVGKVMRFGNLSARHSDGEFQINFATNSAMGRIKAYAMLGCAAFDQLDATMEFSPIDAVAEAVVKLSTTPKECTLFHVFNNQNISMEGIFSELGELGYNIEYVEREDFAKAFTEAKSDPKKAAELTSMMAYMQMPGRKETVRFKRQCEYTMQTLYRLGFAWPITTWDYIERFVSALSGLGYFEEEN